jgi:hypothetical protein
MKYLYRKALVETSAFLYKSASHSFGVFHHQRTMPQQFYHQPIHR